ncbi:MAG: signal peptide peptidase SppA [Acidobacteriota bacterium]
MRRKRLGILHVRLEDRVVEEKSDLGLFGRPSRDDLRQICLAIRRAGKDRRVGGLLLRLAQPALGWSKAASLGRAIQDFRASGKPTVAFLESAGNVDFTLACACETLVMPPSGTLLLQGLQAEAFFIRDLLEWVGIEAELESVGEYKSAGEMFIRREMSRAHREELDAVLRDFSEQMVTSIARSRSFSREQAQELVESGPHVAEEGKETGLIDAVHHEDSCEKLFEDKLGGKVTLIPHPRYPLGDGLWSRLIGFRRPRVAVVYAVGIISRGESRRPRPTRAVVGARSLGALLQRLRESRRVKAVVLRIDSPGGSALASDLIWREVGRTRERKPVVVSMGDVAASGGYLIATAADAVFAEASTLTGSIGVVGGKIVIRRLLDKLGVGRETVRVSGRSGFHSPLYPFTQEEREKLRRHLRYFYEKLFLPRVAGGRKLPMDQVREAARGRVWTGREGKKQGLVDEIGDLEAAITVAREKAGIPAGKKVRIVTYARRPRLRDLLSFRLAQAETRLWPLGAILELVDSLSDEDVHLLMTKIFRVR